MRNTVERQINELDRLSGMEFATSERKARALENDGNFRTLEVQEVHIAMRIQHAAQTAGGLPVDHPGRMQAK